MIGIGAKMMMGAAGRAVAAVAEWALLHTLVNPNPAGTPDSDNFGRASAVCESYSLVGAQEEDVGGTASGSAYLFSNATGALIYTFANPNAAGTVVSDRFSNAVAVCEGYSVIAASAEDVGGTSSGSVYIFENATGALLHTLVNPNAAGTVAGDLFGSAVSVCESYCIVGARSEDVGGTDSGSAYIFDNATGALLHTLVNPNLAGTVDSDLFGSSVGISESYCLVGARNEGDGGTATGAAYIFASSTGALLHTLANPNAIGGVNFDMFGATSAICESYCIVAAIGDGGGGQGTAYIFDNATGSLLHTLLNPNPIGTTSGDNFGASVSISENYAIVGAWGEDVGGSNSGSAYIFSTETGALVYTMENPNATGTPNGDNFGFSVGASESYAVVGAHLEDVGGSGSGSAYIFAAPPP